MEISKAIITVAGAKQRKLPLQTLIDIDGKEKSLLEILVEEINKAGIGEIGIVIHEGDKDTYKQVLEDYLYQITFIEQKKPRGYGHAIHTAREFVGNNYFMHLVGDHLYVNRSKIPCAKRLIDQSKQHSCSVSAVQSTRENLIPYFGVMGGQRIKGSKDIYQIDTVIEKPTPTEAEQKLIIPGQRVGHYLCFFGMHILSPNIFTILENSLNNTDKNINLSGALDTMAKKEQYLALEMNDLRIDVGTPYGIMKAQIALALSGKDRDMVLTELLEFFTMKDLMAQQ